jgi:hypothetical protein
MYKFHNVAQNTDEWLELRIGKVTSSSLATVMANFGKAFGEPAKKYALKIALERLTGKRSEYSFSNEHTERGHEQEPFARQAYEVLNFVDVENGGFFECEKYGASPDGLVGDDGLIEIKSVIAATHFDNLKRGAIDPAYKWQCYANLKISGRKWIDFVSYCEDFTDNKKIIVYRINASECDEQFKMIDERLDEFHSLINETVEMIKSA